MTDENDGERIIDALNVTVTAVQDAVAGHNKSVAPLVTVMDLSQTGDGPFRLMINGVGCADWPWRASTEYNAGDYAEEVARCVRKALDRATPCASETPPFCEPFTGPIRAATVEDFLPTADKASAANFTNDSEHFEGDEHGKGAAESGEANAADAHGPGGPAGHGDPLRDSSQAQRAGQADERGDAEGVRVLGRRGIGTRDADVIEPAPRTSDACPTCAAVLKLLNGVKP